MPPNRSTHGQRSGGLERVMLLRAFPAFAEVDADHLAPLAEIAHEQVVPSGHPFSIEGAPPHTVHYLIDGEVEISRGTEVVATVGPRAILGGLAALAHAPSPYRAVAIKDSTTLAVAQDDLIELLEDGFELLTAMLRDLAAAFARARREAGTSAGFHPPAISSVAGPRALPGHEADRPALDLVDQLSLLRATSPFERAPLEALAGLAREGHVVRLHAGRCLWRAGDPSRSCLVVASGIIAGRAHAPDQWFELGSGSIAGGLDSLAAIPRWYSAKVARDATCFQFSAGALVDVMEDHLELAIDLLRGLARGVLRLRLAAA